MSTGERDVPKRIYLDVCALCRPFDDQQQVRIRLETSAVELILTHVRNRQLELIVSPAHFVEINAIPDLEERQQLILLLRQIGTEIEFDFGSARRGAEALSLQGLGVADAAHLAFAEQAQAEFITVDDKLLKQSVRTKSVVWCGTPPALCEKEELQ